MPDRQTEKADYIIIHVGKPTLAYCLLCVSPKDVQDYIIFFCNVHSFCCLTLKRQMSLNLAVLLGPEGGSWFNYIKKNLPIMLVPHEIGHLPLHKY